MTAHGHAAAGLSTESRLFHLPARISWASRKMPLQLFFEA
jgi:hypothetical protein